MLKKVTRKRVRTAGGAYAIVASEYNTKYVEAMLSAAQNELTAAGADSVKIVRVPGAYEVPIAAARLARQACSCKRDLAAIICLGVILRGETVHAAHIGDAVSRALMDIQLDYEIPVIHEVLLLENEAQAQKRCLSKTHNRGAEAAQTALAMAQVMRQLNSLS